MTKRDLNQNLKYYIIKCGDIVCIARTYRRAVRRQKEFLQTTRNPVEMQEMEQMSIEDYFATIDPKYQIWVEE